MPKVRQWRELIESGNAGLRDVRALTAQEAAAMGEEPDLRNRAAAASQEHALKLREELPAFKQETWFYPSVSGQTWNLYDAILGWNHALVLRPLGLGMYCPEFIFQYTSDTFHKVHGGIGVDIHEAGKEGEWTVHAVRQKVPLRRVTTYNATTCSISVVYPKAGEGRILISHIDASPPIPIGDCLSWCARHDRSVVHLSKVQTTRELLAIASVCAHADEVDKFEVSGFAGGSWSYNLSTVILTRGRIVGQDVRPSEFQTQYGLVFQRGQLPRLRGFLWNQRSLYQSLVPSDVQRDIGRLAAAYTGKVVPLQKQIGEQDTKLTQLKSAKLVFNRARKQETLETDLQKLKTLSSDQRDALGLEAMQVLNPLLRGEAGMGQLHRAVFNQLVALNNHPTLEPYLAAILELQEVFDDPMSAQALIVDQQIEAYRRRVDIVLDSASHTALRS